jgi:hypothetical protein
VSASQRATRCGFTSQGVAAVQWPCLDHGSPTPIYYSLPAAYLEKETRQHSPTLNNTSTWAASKAPWPLLNRVCQDLSPKRISRLLHTTRLSAKGEVCRFHRLRSSLFTRLGRHRLHRPGYQSLTPLQALQSTPSHPPAGQRMLRQCPDTPHFGKIMTSRENSEPALKALSIWEDTRQVARLWL